ncbi:MAG: hypothetical protein ACJ8LL_13870, partial [Candidatus Udaeobacter sp.]
ILKVKRRQKVVTPGDKKTRFRPRNKLSRAPDAVSAEYRGKITICKKYFGLQLSFRAKSRNL